MSKAQAQLHELQLSLERRESKRNVCRFLVLFLFILFSRLSKLGLIQFNLYFFFLLVIGSICFQIFLSNPRNSISFLHCSNAINRKVFKIQWNGCPIWCSWFHNFCRWGSALTSCLKQLHNFCVFFSFGDSEKLVLLFL